MLFATSLNTIIPINGEVEVSFGKESYADLKT